MTESNHVFSVVADIIHSLSAKEHIKIDDNIKELNMDSLTMVTLLVELEEKFNIELSESDLNPYELETVQAVCELVNKYI